MTLEKMRTPKRQKIWDITNGHCFYCRMRLMSDSDPFDWSRERDLRFCQMQIDHKLPLKRGGDNKRDNLVPCCGYCNLQKGSKAIEEYRAYLLERNVVAKFHGEVVVERDWVLVASCQPPPWPLRLFPDHAHRPLARP